MKKVNKIMFLLGLMLSTSACVSIQTGDTDLNNPFAKEYKIHVSEAKGVNGHYIIQGLQEELEKSGKNNKKSIDITYSVKNKLSEMSTTYGKVMLPFEIFSLGIVDLLGVPSDFYSQTVYMTADVKNAYGRSVGKYTAKGSSWHPVACYYGYSFESARKLADVDAFNDALQNLYDNIQGNNKTFEVSPGATLTNKDFDHIVGKFVNDIILSGSLDTKNNKKYTMIISDIEMDTKNYVDVDIFTKKFKVALQKQNKVIMTAMGKDSMLMKSRELRNSEEVEQSNVANKKSLIAPDISLTGKIIDNALSSKKVEYTIMLSINNLKTGTVLWEGEQSIVKDNKN